MCTDYVAEVSDPFQPLEDPPPVTNMLDCSDLDVINGNLDERCHETLSTLSMSMSTALSTPAWSTPSIQSKRKPLSALRTSQLSINSSYKEMKEVVHVS